MKRRQYLILFFAVVLLGAACAPTQSWKSEPSIKTVSNTFFNASITPVFRFNGYKGFVLNMHNKTAETIEIDWNNTFYIHSGNKDGGFWFESIQNDTQKKLKPSPVAAGEMFTIEIFPAKLRVLSRMAGAYVNEDMGPGENGIFITVTVQGKTISETLTFIFSE
jgi:hypothetical protein